MLAQRRQEDSILPGPRRVGMGTAVAADEGPYNSCNSDHSDDDENDGIDNDDGVNAEEDADDDDDPLMDLFETHATRRVMFDGDVAGGQEKKENVGAVDGAGEGCTSAAVSAVNSTGAPVSDSEEDGSTDSDNSDNAAYASIKAFVNRIVFKGGKEKESELPRGLDGSKVPREKGSSVADVNAGFGELSLGSRQRAYRENVNDGGSGEHGNDPRTSESRRGSLTNYSADSSSQLQLRRNVNAPLQADASGPRKLDPSAIDRAIKRSAEAAKTAKKASKIDGRYVRKQRVDKMTGDFPTVGSSGGRRGGLLQGTQAGDGFSGTKNSFGKEARRKGARSPFVPDPDVEERARLLLGRARRARTHTYRYERSIGFHLAALRLLSNAGYPDDHPLPSEALRSLNDSHHAQSSLQSSTNIVKMGVKQENRGKFVKALKLYIVAYRIRRDALGKYHPSLPVLLNMLGSVQVKRGELEQAMKVYILALHGRPDDESESSSQGEGSEENEANQRKTGARGEKPSRLVHPAIKSVTLRDMGMIHEQWGDDEKALELYRESLDCFLKGKRQQKKRKDGKEKKTQVASRRNPAKDQSSNGGDKGGMESLKGSPQSAGEPTSGSVSRSAVRSVNSYNGCSISGANHAPARENHTKPRVILAPALALVSSKDDDGAGSLTSQSSERGQCKQRNNLSRSLSRNSDTTQERGEMEMCLDASDFDFKSTLPVQGEGAESSEGETSKEDQSCDYTDIFDDDNAKGGDHGQDNQGGGRRKERKKKRRKKKKKKRRTKKKKGGARVGINNINYAMTLLRMAQIYRRRHRYAAALSAYRDALRWMKRALGSLHPNVASVLGNLGNLHKEMGNYDAAYDVYQEVLSIETLHLGLVHPEVSVTIHNIATIESERGRYVEASSLYNQAIVMQRSLFGPSHISVAVTSSCMGDVFERMGDLGNAAKSYEDSLRIRSEILGTYHVDVGRLLHKLGILSTKSGALRAAYAYLGRASEIYTRNGLEGDHQWVRDMKRDRADVKAELLLGIGSECL